MPRLSARPLKIMVLIAVFLTIPLLPGICQEQKEFDITVAGISIGEMSAVKTVTNGITIYHVKSSVRFWFFGWISLDYFMNSEYHGKQLIKVDGAYNTNRGIFETTVAWKDDHYEVNAKGYKFENNKPVDKPLYHSSAVFFFEEPIGVTESMADNFGLVSPIRKVRDCYEVDVAGDKNKFYYVDGIFDHAVMYSPIKNYVIKRK